MIPHLGVANGVIWLEHIVGFPDFQEVGQLWCIAFHVAIVPTAWNMSTIIFENLLC
jgi:hypothetical protein